MEALSRGARNAALLLTLLLVFFFSLSYQVNRARTLTTASGTVLGAVSPAYRLASAAWLAVAGAWARYVDLIGAADEAGELRDRVAVLKRRLRALDEAERENRRLRELLRLPESRVASSVVGRVVGRDFAHRYESVSLDRGSVDGVRVDAAVIAPDGALVGRVVQVARWTCLVQLITDPLSGVGARLTGSRAAGLVAGGGGPELTLRYISSAVEVDEGEPVVTSGEDGIYPAGLTIGRVVTVRIGPPIPGTPHVPLAREEAALFREIVVEPSIDALELETVLVLAPDAS